MVIFKATVALVALVFILQNKRLWVQRLDYYVRRPLKVNLLFASFHKSLHFEILLALHFLRHVLLPIIMMVLVRCILAGHVLDSLLIALPHILWH